MTSTAPDLIPSALAGQNLSALDNPALETGLKRWIKGAELAAKIELHCQIMAGFHLLELQERMPETRGGDRKSPAAKIKVEKNSTLIDQASQPSFQARVQALTGYHYRTCRNWMLMARGLMEEGRAAALELPADVLDKAVSSWTPEEEERLSTAVANVTSGWKQIDFLREMGLAKGPDTRERRERGVFVIGEEEPEGDEVGVRPPVDPPAPTGPRKKKLHGLVPEDSQEIADAEALIRSDAQAAFEKALEPLETMILARNRHEHLWQPDIRLVQERLHRLWSRIKEHNTLMSDASKLGRHWTEHRKITQRANRR